MLKGEEPFVPPAANPVSFIVNAAPLVLPELRFAFITHTLAASLYSSIVVLGLALLVSPPITCIFPPIVLTNKYPLDSFKEPTDRVALAASLYFSTVADAVLVRPGEYPNPFKTAPSVLISLALLGFTTVPTQLSVAGLYLLEFACQWYPYPLRLNADIEASDPGKDVLLDQLKVESSHLSKLV